MKNRIYCQLIVLLLGTILLISPSAAAAGSNDLPFIGDIYTCDADGYATDVQRNSFAANEMFCLKGFYLDDNQETRRSIVAEWEDGLEMITAFVAKDVAPEEIFHWSFYYTDPNTVLPNTGWVTVRDLESCETLARYPVSFFKGNNDLAFSGVLSVCDDQYAATDQFTSLFNKEQAVCLEGWLSHGNPQESYALEFLWQDGKKIRTRIPIENVHLGEHLTTYFYYKNPAEAASNSGSITVYNAASNKKLASYSIHMGDDAEIGAPFTFTADTYRCDAEHQPTTEQTAQFSADEFICVAGESSGSNSGMAGAVTLHWEDGLGNDVVLIEKDLFPGDRNNWYFNYLDPALVAPNSGTITIRDYDSCEILETLPVEVVQSVPDGDPEVQHFF